MSVYEPAVVGRPLESDDLVARARGGDVDAFAQIVREHQHIAFRTALFITRDAAEAEDAAQEGFAKAYRALGRFREGAPLRPWLLTIVANEARNRRRSAGRRDALVLRAAEGGASGDPARSPEALLLESERREELLRGLATLREEDRLVIACRYLLELDERETAAVLDLRLGTVKSRTHRALGRLREAMGGTQ